MSKKVYEIAKELDMDNKDLLEKIHGMGIEAKSHNSVLSDIDAKSVENWILHSRKSAETKIVMAAPSSASSQNSQENEVRIAVKPAAVAQMRPKEKVEPKTRPEPPKPTRLATPPVGKPLPKATIAPPAGVPLPRAASAQPPIGTPLPKSASLQPSHEKKEPETDETKLPENVQQDGKQEINTDVNKEITTQAAPKAEAVTAEAPKAQPVKTEPQRSSQPQRPESGERTEHREPRQDRPNDRPANRPNDRPVNRPNDRPTDRPANRPTDRPAGRPGDRPANRPGDRPAGRPGDRPAGRPGDRPANRPGDRPAFSGPKPAGGDIKPAIPAKPGAASPFKKNKPGKPGEKDKHDGKRDVGKQAGPAAVRTMEKPAFKKPHKKKLQKPEEEERKINYEELAPGTKIVNVPITVKGLSEQIGKTTSDVIMALMKLGVMANINQNLDEETVVLIGDELGMSIVVDKVAEELVEEGLETFEDKEEDLAFRPPVVTVMGHVVHGKTSLLDAIRKTSVTATESGGITQHIGASEAMVNGQKIVFLDTPGHEAFTTMRARGAHGADIAVLVVAADDGVMPQTVESISHAKAAGVPIIVAINKMDKPDANPERVKQELTEHGILVEDWGGDTISVPVSAKSGEGIVNLLEMILLQAEVLELKANPNRLAMGTVIEARLDKNKGPVATLLVLNGTLQAGMSVVAGTSSGKVRAMTNFKGGNIRKAGPATAVEITGLSEVPEAGDEFHAVKEDRIAREIAEQRRIKQREEVMQRNASVTLDQLFSQIQEGEIKELNLIVKADVQGSVGALTQSLEKLQTENVKVRIIHSGVGTVTESDIMLASTSNAIIIGFNIRPNTNISALAEREKVEIRTYRVIYEIIDEIEAALKGMLDPIFKEVVLGKAEIRNTFKVPGAGMVGGAYILEGKMLRNAEIRLVRDGIVIHEGKISSLRRFKEDAKEVAQGYECGIGIENFNDIKEFDIIEAFKMEEIERK